jgi:uncharacterized linocin/CFP29 family protein
MSAIDVVPAVPAPDGAVMNNLGRSRLDWDASLWDRLDKQVCAEMRRARVSTKFLPVVNGTIGSNARTVPADAFRADRSQLSIPEGDEIPLEEHSVPFVLTKQQYEAEERLGTAVTLATRAANVLARGMDDSVFQSSPNGSLLQRAEENGDVVGVALTNREHPEDEPDKYGENTFGAVEDAYARLEGRSHYGPYALISHFAPYADAHAPLANTLIMPADRIHALMTAGFYGTGTLPAKRAVMVSIGGNTVDVALAVDAVTAFIQIGAQETYQFRVYERFTVRVKDPTAFVVLHFE